MLLVLQISLMSGLIEDSWIFMYAFVFNFVVGFSFGWEILALHRKIGGKRKIILIAF